MELAAIAGKGIFTISVDKTGNLLDYKVIEVDSDLVFFQENKNGDLAVAFSSDAQIFHSRSWGKLKIVLQPIKVIHTFLSKEWEVKLPKP